jgi:hypothetical protein
VEAVVGGPKDPEQKRAYNKAYYEKHKDELLPKIRVRVKKWEQEHREQRAETCRRQRRNDPERHNGYQKTARLRLKTEVMGRLGGCCACCGETQLEFLAVDHINGDGARHRQQYQRGSGQLYREVKKMGFPKHIFQVLCHNCNFSKYLGKGVCVHRRRP